MALSFTWLLLSLAVSVHGFKDKEFKKCNDLGFCRRLRGKMDKQFTVEGSSLSVSGPTLSATMVNPAAPGKQFSFQLAAYEAGILRLNVDELPDAGRYRILDITNPQLSLSSQAWTQTSSSASSAVYSLGDSSIELTFSPFKLAVSSFGKPTATLNSRNMFTLEHRRTKESPDAECDGCWEESFLSHQDTKPKGPEAVSLDITFPGFDHVYGIPERATSLALKETTGGEPYRMYNLDVFEYLHESPFGLYGSIPFMLAHKQGMTTGVFWLNSAEIFVDVSKVSGGMGTQWMAESGIVDLFLFAGPGPREVVRQYSFVTGTTALPQLFSIGYHQCRWNYDNEEDVHKVDSGFDSHAIPYDVIWLDIEHTNGKRYLTWDSNVFPEPIALQEDLASRGRKMVTIVDPHVKRDHTYNFFKEAEAAKYFVRNRHGSDFEGWCWPGSSSYLDVTSPVVRQWWAQQFTYDKYPGSTSHLYIWNDMNEPSVFNGPEITMHKDNIHDGEVEHRNVHNLYGLYYHQSTADGLAHRGNIVFGEDGDRPFVLSRAFYSGTQRVGPIWTGDNAANWDHLRVSVPMLLTLGITGLPFSGADVGGFFGNPEPELMVRWFQLGTYYPFFRGHAHLETQRREPWMLGEPYTTRIKDAIRDRYALLPYFYTLFRHANLTGDPILAPMWYDFPDNKDTFSLDQQMMVGPAMLVAPVLSPQVSHVDVLLPRTSRWFHALSGVEMEKNTWLPGLDQWHRATATQDTIPAFYRGGYILPRRERPRRSTATQSSDPITLVVSLDHKQEATGDLYLDDGRSNAFLKGQYLHRVFTFSSNKLTSTKAPTAAAAVVPGELVLPSVSIERIAILGLPKKGTYTVTLPGGKVVPLEQGPLSQRAPTAVYAHVVRAPWLPISEDWAIEISKA